MQPQMANFHLKFYETNFSSNYIFDALDSKSSK